MLYFYFGLVYSQAELAEANRLADQRMDSARSLQMELERIRPRVCHLVASLAGPSALSYGGGDSIGGYGDGAGNGSIIEGGGDLFSPQPPLASRSQQYILAAQEVAAATDAFQGARSLSISGAEASTSLSSRSREARGHGKAGGGGGSGGQDGLRASLDELCSLHDELGAIGRLPPDQSGGSENINRLMASIQMCRADAEARLELAAAALSDPGDPGAVDAPAHAAELAMERATSRRSRIGDPFNPKMRRLAATAPSASPGEDDRTEDKGGSSSAVVAAIVASASAPSSASSSRATRNPYARDLYMPRSPRHLREEEGLFAGTRSGGGSAGRGASARWERQAHEHPPVARRRQLAAEELARQQSATGVPRSARAAAAATTAAVAAATSSEGGAQSQASAPASSLSSTTIFFPPSSHNRAGAGQPAAPMPPTFRFGRTAPAASPLTQSGHSPVFSSGSGSMPPVSSGGRRPRLGNRRSSRAEDAERVLRGTADGDSDPFFSSLPQLPPPASHFPGRVGPSAAASGSGGAGATSAGVASVKGSAADPPENTTGAERAPANYPPDMTELVELYCRRCHDLSLRLCSAVADRDALAASTMEYLRAGRAFGGIGGGVAGAWGAHSRRTSASATVVSAGVGNVDPFRWRSERESTVWGGGGSQHGAAAALRQPCCVKCTEEVLRETISLWLLISVGRQRCLNPDVALFVKGMKHWKYF